MAVIKFKRGSGVPTGLTAYEAAWDTSAGRFFINNGSTAVWIGARIDPATDLGAAGSCAFFVPTQLAVKTYVDGQVAGGAVSSINGATGVVSILGGTGISVSTSLANKGITIGVNSNVALLDTAQTFTALKSFSAGLSASGGITFANAITVSNAINAGSTTMSIFGTAQSISIGASSATGNNSITLGNNAYSGTLSIGAGTINLTSEAVATTVAVTTFGKHIQLAPSPMVIMGGSTPTLTIDATDNGSGFVSVDGGNLYLGRITESTPSSRTIAAGIVFEGDLNNNSETTLTVVDPTADRTIELPNDSGQIALTKNVVTSVNGTTGAVVDVASLNSATGAVSLFAGAGLSVASSTSIRGITFTNTGVLTNVAGSGISVSGATGNVTITNTGVLSFNGNIGAVQGVSAAVAGSGISVSGPTGSVTITNTGVLSNVAGSGINVSAGTGNVTITNAGVTGLVAGTGISVSSATGNVTITNAGVQSIAGTTNQITASSSTGAVTLSLPSAVTMPGSLTVTGDLTVNGTTTTVNSNTVTIQDPLIAIGGAGTTNAPPPNGDVKDRGLLFQWNNGSAGRTGFLGHDQSTGYFTYIPNISSLSGDIVTGTAGTAQLNEVRGLSGVTFTITAPATTSSLIEMRGGAAYNNTLIALESSIVEIGNYGSRSGIKFTEGGRGHVIYPSSSMSASRTYDLPDHSGTFVVPSDLGTSKYLLMATGATTQPTWISPDDVSTGITASASKLVAVSSDTSDSTCFLTFINTAANSNQAVKYNSSLAYNSTTNYLDVNIDCGAY